MDQASPLGSQTPLMQAQCALHDTSIALPDFVLVVVSDFLDTSSTFTLAAAAASRSVSLFERVYQRVQSNRQTDSNFAEYWMAGAMEAAIKNDDLAMVQKIHALHPEPLVLHSLVLALTHGTLELVQWMIDHRRDRQCCQPGVKNLCRSCMDPALRVVGKQDPVRVVQWLALKGYPLSFEKDGLRKSPLYDAALQSCELLRWLDERGLVDDAVAELLLRGAIEDNTAENLDMVQYLVERSCVATDSYILKALVAASCKSNKESVVEYLISTPLCDSIRDKFMYAAARTDGEKVLQWDQVYMTETVLSSGRSLADEASFHATQYGHLDTLRWLFGERGVAPMAMSLRNSIPQEKLLAMYEWMWEQEIELWSPENANSAAANGYLQTIEWLDIHVPATFTTKTMDYAAKNGHLEVVQWLAKFRSDGCTSAAVNLAAANGHLAVVEYLSTHRSTGRAKMAMLSAASMGQLEVVKWLHDYDSENCSRCVLQALLRRPEIYSKTPMSVRAPVLNSLRWLQAHPPKLECLGTCVGHPKRDEGYHISSAAADWGDLQLLEYLEAQKLYETERDPGLATFVGRFMLHGGHENVMQWLWTHHREDFDWPSVRHAAYAAQRSRIVDWIDTTMLRSQEIVHPDESLQ